MERVQSLQKMQVLTRQKANLAAQLEACLDPPSPCSPSLPKTGTLRLWA